MADQLFLHEVVDSVGRVDDLVAAGHQHEERYWALRLPGALAFLLGPREEQLAP